MQHTLYFKIPNALVKIECDDNHMDMVLDDMARIAAILIPGTDFDETKVITQLHTGDALMHFTPN